MQNKKLYTGTKLLIALVLLVFMPVSSQAFEVIFEGNNATEVRKLRVEGAIYNVAFLATTSKDIYDTPPTFDFDTPQLNIKASELVQGALNSVDAVETVGPNSDDRFAVGARDQTTGGSAGSILVYLATYDDGLADSWDVADKKGNTVFGVKSVVETETYTYAKFTQIAECSFDIDCDDGLFCNGEESCVEGECQDGTDPCEEDEICNEDTDICEPKPPEPCECDLDTDGDCDGDDLQTFSVDYGRQDCPVVE